MMPSFCKTTNFGFLVIAAMGSTTSGLFSVCWSAVTDPTSNSLMDSLPQVTLIRLQSVLVPSLLSAKSSVLSIRPTKVERGVSISLSALAVEDNVSKGSRQR